MDNLRGGRILIVDDERGMGEILIKSLKLEGLEATAYTDPRAALAAIPSDQPDVILTDVRMPGMTGMELLDAVCRDYPDIPVIVMTAYGTIEDAVATLKAGAFNYITKPFQQEDLLHQLRLAARQRQLELEVARLSEPRAEEEVARKIIGSSAGLAQVREMISRAASTDSAVLINGESGVGKELVAREIHAQSARKNQAFVAINCPAIPVTLIESEMFGHERGAFTGASEPKMGLIELSGGGTLFLDEIGELPLELQPKLLRTLQEREVQRLGGLSPLPVDLRVVSATNRDLEEEIEAGNFRPDLFYRLHVIRIEVPPLRERTEDLAELADYYIDRICRRFNRPVARLEDDALLALKQYRWPGNIREYANVLERMLIFTEGDVLGLDSIPRELRPKDTDRLLGVKTSALTSSGGTLKALPDDYKQAREAFEREYLEALLKRYGGNVTEAAKRSGISRRNLYERLDKYGLKDMAEKIRGGGE